MVNYKKLVIYFLVFFIAVSPAYASTLAGSGWSQVGSLVSKGASSILSATKKVVVDGKSVVKTSTALITPTAKQVAKVLARGAAGYALSVAVEQLIGAVDWVLDPENNQIKYKEIVCADGSSECSNFVYLARINVAQTEYHDTKQQACNAAAAFYNASSVGGKIKFTALSDDKNSCLFDVISTATGLVTNKISVSIHSKAVENTEEEDRVLPLDAVAAQVISNAEGGDTDAQSATNAAAADIVAEAEKDSTKARPIVNELEANAKTQTEADANTATGQTKPNTETGGTDLALEFPIFCNWATTVCEAAQVVITKPNEWAISISEAYTSTKEWFQKDRDNLNDQINIPTPTNPNINTDINFNSSCPAPITLANFSYHGSSQNWQVDFSQLCDSFSTFVKPVVIAMGAFSAVLIVSGVRTNE